MNVLILDDKNNALANLPDLLINAKLKAVYSKDPISAINTLKKHKFDVVISAYDIQKTTLLNLFKALSIKFQTIVRIAVPFDEYDKAIEGMSHYVFEKPSEFSQIISTLQSFEDSNKAITSNVIVNAVSSVKTLPSPPKVYLQLNAILKNKNSDSEQIAEIISQSPALVAKVLHFSNTSFMPNGKKITSITEAITKMGVEAVSCVVMTAEMFSYQPDIPNFSLQDEQLHSISTARFAATLVDPAIKHDALLVGLLHDIGKLVLFEIDKALTLKYFDNCARTKSDVLLEHKIFTTDHCRIGAYLMHLWCFPYQIIEGVLLHHSPKKLLKSTFGVSQALYLANCLLREQEPDNTFIEHFKLTDKLENIKKKAERFK